MNERSSFNAWQARLHKFVAEHGRCFTQDEWKWMRMQFELENFQGFSRQLAMAADGDDLERSMLRQTLGTKVFSFASDGEDRRLTVTLRPQQEGRKFVYLKMTDRDGNPVSSGVVRFPGVAEEIRLNENGRAKLDYGKYLECLRDVLCLEYSETDGRVCRMELE